MNRRQVLLGCVILLAFSSNIETFQEAHPLTLCSGRTCSTSIISIGSAHVMFWKHVVFDRTPQSFLLRAILCNQKRPACLAEAYESTELFCGTAWVTKCMSRAGLRTAALDVNMGSPPPGNQNAYDIMTPAGMASFGFNKMFLLGPLFP